MIKAINSVTEHSDETTRDDDKKVVSTLKGAITLATQCFHYINILRCQTMKIDIHGDNPELCTSTTVPATSEYVFGDLSKLTNDISDAHKLARGVCPLPPHSHINRKFHSGLQRQGYQSSQRFQCY